MSLPESLPRILAWLATYGLHSTLLLGLAWLATRRSRGLAAQTSERIWRLAVLGPLLTASLSTWVDRAPTLASIARAEPPATAVRSPENEPQPRAADARTAAARTDPPHRTTTDSKSDRRASRSARVTRLSRRKAAPSSGIRPRRPITRSDGETGAPRPAGERDTPTRRVRGPRERPDAVPASPPREPSETSTSDALHRDAATPGLLARLRLPSATEATTLLWTVPATVLTLGLLGGALWLALSLRRRRPVDDPELRARFEALRVRAGVRRSVRLTVCDRLDSPITLGLLRPEICLPPRALHGLSRAYERSLFAHELGHVARRDPAWFLLLAFLERALFFQPLLRVARARLVELAEERADDLAVRWTGDPIALAGCLTEIAGWFVERRTPTALPVAGMAGTRLAARVERLLVPARPAARSHRWMQPSALLLLATTAGAAPRIAAFAEPAVTAEMQPVRTAPTTAASGAVLQPAGPSSPSVTVRGHARPPAQPAPLPTSTLAVQYAEVERELDLLGGELGALRRDLAAEPDADLAAALDALERRYRSLTALRSRARLLLDPTTPNPPGASAPRASGTK